MVSTYRVHGSAKNVSLNGFVKLHYIEIEPHVKRYEEYNRYFRVCRLYFFSFQGKNGTDMLDD